MTWLDCLIQRWRIQKASLYVPKAARVLDIGCADGALFRHLGFLRGGIGIDPDLQANLELPNANLIAGFFPQDLPDKHGFDVITMLAVLEHIPRHAQGPLAKDCFAVVKAGGKLIITVPSPFVDKILDVLKLLRLVDGIRIDQHYGYDAKLTPEIFNSAGFELVQSRKFQLGLNNLFVFRKPIEAK